MKAYENKDFIHSAEGRVLRILAEFYEPQRRLKKHNIEDTIVFFGSARPISSVAARKKLKELRQKMQGKKKPSNQLKQELTRMERVSRLGKYYDDAVTLSRMMTEWANKIKDKSKHFVVCSGGGPGMMEASNKGAKQAKGLSVGFTISMKAGLEKPNPYITKDMDFEFHYFFMRKYWFAYLAKALVIFPGGFGTLDELMEILTLMQTQKIRKPLPIVVYGREYWDDIINFEKFVEWGTISPKDLKLFRFCDTPEEAYDYLTSELKRLYLK